MAGVARRGRRGEINIWPAFVDAQAQLVMGIIFLLTVFTVAQVVTTDQLSGRDAALARLHQQLNELNELLALERRANSDLRLNAAQLSSELQSSSVARDALTTRVAELAAKAQDETARADRLAAQLADANQTVSADREKIEVQLKELESIRRDVEALKKLRAELEAQVTQLAASDQQAQQALTAARDRSKELEARLSTEQERTALAQRDIQQRDVRLSELQQQGQQTNEALAAEKQLSRQAQDQVDLLGRQIQALRDQIARVSAALELAEKDKSTQQTTIADLGRRLNLALASKVEELARYRSEFFGRIRQALGDRPDIRVVGDRFVFQSEVLFAPASAELGDDAKRQLAPIVTALVEIMKKMPTDLNWVLRVDGHTDKRPIATPQFPSNWELSTARAISVVKFLAASGIPPERLAATGFGEYQPLDARDDEIAFRRNRRIELKLTER
jgi:chemotaxis protein MotB